MHFSLFSVAISWFVNIVTTNFGISGSTSKKKYKENDWTVKHARYSDLWNNHQRKDPQDGPAWHAGPHREYLRWYHTSTRTRIKPTLTDEHIEDAPSDSDDDIADVMSLAQARIGLWQAQCTDYSV
jgi:hypothetical protein